VFIFIITAPEVLKVKKNVAHLNTHLKIPQ